VSAKRAYSREFTPQTERRVQISINRVPPTLLADVKAKAKREGVSLRTLILRLLTKWLQEGEGLT
jgi:predicted DNA binding CopG/RHH family protein